MHNKSKILTTLLDQAEALLAFELYNLSKEDYIKFIDIISKPVYNLSLDSGINPKKLAKVIEAVFPDRDPIKDKKIDKYILKLAGLRECKSCCNIYSHLDFYPNKNRSDGYNSYCKECQASQTKRTQPARQAKYKAALLRSVPSWADLKKIALFYSKTPEGYEVDHIVPLQGENVCGLHVENNLQYLSKLDNIIKHNKFAE